VQAFVGALAAWLLALVSPAWATSQGPVADGPYLGTLPCADCAGIRTELTLFTMGPQGQPDVYRMRTTHLGTREADRTEERMGPWLRMRDGGGDRVRLEPYNDALRQTFRRKDADTLVLLDRDEKPIDTQQNRSIVRDKAAVPAPRIEVSRTLFRGTLRREADKLLLVPCGGGQPIRVHDVSPEVVISAVLADLGFDRRDSLYVEAFGRRHDGALMFERLNRAGFEMRCPQPAEAMTLRAQGNEPGWSLVSGARGLVLTRMGEPDFIAPPRRESWRWPGGRSDRAAAVVSAATEGGGLTAVLTPKICRDTMADAAYGFTAVVNVERPTAATLKGCGYLGNATLP
jgi:putative lipoprotein